MHHVIQIKLKSVTIIENGQAKEGPGNNVLSATLVYPTPHSPVAVAHHRDCDES